jgi:hypothetical protein
MIDKNQSSPTCNITVKNHFEMDMTDVQLRALLGLKQELREGALTFFIKNAPVEKKLKILKSPTRIDMALT